MPVIETSLDKLQTSRLNERTSDYDKDKLETLKTNIESAGIASPPIAREMDDGTFEVIIGQRRVAAAELAGLGEIPVIIMDWSDREAIIASISENVTAFSEEVSTRDRAEALHNLWKEMGREGRPEPTELAEELGVDRQRVYRWLEPLRDEWKGTDLDPAKEDEDGDGESDAPERPADDGEFDDDPIGGVGDISPDDDREPEEMRDDEEYDGPDSYTDGADSTPAPADGGAGTTMPDPEDANTETPEPSEAPDAPEADVEAEDAPTGTPDADEGVTEIVDGDADGETEVDGEDGEASEEGADEEDEDGEADPRDDPMEELGPELADMSPDKIASVRRMTGGGHEGVEVLRKVKDLGLSNHQLREAGHRVNNGAEVDAAIEAVAEGKDGAGPRLHVSFTLRGVQAQQVADLAALRGVSAQQVALDAVEQHLEESQDELED